MALRLLIAATTSASEPKAALSPPPYQRYVLDSTSVVPWNNIPSAMRGVITDESWQAFWSQIQPIVQQVEEFHQKRFLWSILRYVIVFTVLSLLGAHVDVEAHHGFLLLFVALVVSRRKLNAWMVQNQQDRLETLRQVCLRAEATVFRRHGWTIDCDYVWQTAAKYHSFSTRLPYALNLYFVPSASTDPSIPLDAVEPADGQNATRHGFLRLQHFHSGRICGGTVTADHSYNALPPALLADDTDVLWTTFWSELIRRQINRTHWIRAAIAAYLILAAWLVVGTPFLLIPDSTTADVTVDNGTKGNLWLGGTLLIFGAVLIFSRKLNALEAGIREFVHESALELAQLGLYMEPRTVWGCDSLYLKVDYVYLFPMMQSAGTAKAKSVPTEELSNIV